MEISEFFPVMNRRIQIKYLRTRRVQQLICSKCGNEIKVGDSYKRVGNQLGRGSIYHKDCYEQSFIEL